METKASEENLECTNSNSNLEMHISDTIKVRTNDDEHNSNTSTNSTSNGFDGYGFSDELIKTLRAKGYKEPTPIQKAAFPELMLGRDLLGQAQTGTGKTAAFALPILERLNGKKRNPQVLVLTPTRELAMQVADSFRAYAEGHPEIKILAIYGGTDFRYQLNSLNRGVDIVVGTPGRVMDHMRQKTMVQDSLNCLVLDEADEMLRMGFIDDIEWILEQLPKERQMIFFSATMPTEIRRLAKQYLSDPSEIIIKSKEKEARLIKQKYITIQNSYKILALQRILETISGEAVIIFARTKAITIRVAEELEALNHSVGVLNGDVPQNLRERTVERLKQGGIDILVATDVAARGLDVERIGMVINFDMPFDSEAYIHRIGRTGRAGRTGEAILFISPREKSYLRNLERAAGQTIEKVEIPSNESINKHRIEKLKSNLLLSAASPRKDEREIKILENMIEQLKEELEIKPDEIALAALNLVIGESTFMINEDEAWRSQPENHRFNQRSDNQSRNRKRQDQRMGVQENDKERFRIDVGYRDKVKPGNIVGAIANETGLKGKMIGRIQIFDTHSFVDLPKGMPPNIFKSLKKVKIMNRELNINRIN